MTTVFSDQTNMFDHFGWNVMFDDVRYRGGQTIQHFTEHLKAIEMVDEMLACF